jgi:hypothetical protein
MRGKSSTEHPSRAKSAESVKLTVREVLTKHEASDRKLADEIDVAPSLFSRRLDTAEKSAHLLLVDVERMPDEMVVDIYRALLARRGFDVVPSGVSMDARSAVMVASSILAAASALAPEVMKAGADDRLDRTEAVPLRELARVLRDHGGAVMNECDKAIQDGVVPLVAGFGARGIS